MARKKGMYEKFQNIRDGYKKKLELIAGNPDSTLAEDLSGYLSETAQQLRKWRSRKSSGYFTRQESKEINELYKEIVTLKKQCDSHKNWIEKAVEIYERIKKGE